MARNQWQKNGWIFVAIFLVVAVFLLLRLPSFVEPLWHNDEGLYAAIAVQMDEGDLLYRDAWDHKPPGVYLVYWFLREVSGSQFYFGIKFFNLVLGLATLTLAALASSVIVKGESHATKIGGICAALLSAVIFGTMWFEGNILNAENIFVPLVLLGLFLLFRQNEDHSLRGLLLTGLVFGLAFIIKFHPILDFAAVLLFLYLTFMRKHISEMGIARGSIQFGLKYYPLLLGFLAPITLSLLYFRLIDALDIYIFSIATFNIGYSNQIIADIWTYDFYSRIAPWTKAITVTFVTLSLSAAYWFGKLGRIPLLILLLLSLETFGALLANRIYFHYFLQMTPGFVLLFSWISSHKQIRFRLKAAVYLILVGFVLFIFSLRVNISGESHVLGDFVSSYYSTGYRYILGDASQQEWDSRFFIEQEANAELISLIRPYQGGEVFIYSRYSWPYSELALDNPNRYFVVAHIKATGEEGYLLDQLEQETPEVIVLDESFSTPLSLRQLLLSDYNYRGQSSTGKFSLYELK